MARHGHAPGRYDVGRRCTSDVPRPCIVCMRGRADPFTAVLGEARRRMPGKDAAHT
ncbi:hypothetical protein SLNWT_0362 [Streptomyces albus]|uniref:Uncharacterized protein n=1 Tax=Streptomyces albus (strain ATCC 21838 / DSM 41398 / FERM P-419 / JCM 4703 / NBRC 107858) TaxID=1081613 RepID=A0A0B5EFE7_STRA4|nr:hypothetical protein SLNWT_0362 [Streptomyces albus]AOU75049.1 hypothetical protein SLNHY_0358 [Streptomyces albus]AYN30855.1 hypothetical protein DUI70_0353 [Streptomyces albus]